MRSRFLTVKQVYDNPNRKSVRKFLACLIFDNPYNDNKHLKIKLCRTYANKEYLSGRSLNRQQANFKRIGTVKKHLMRGFNKDHGRTIDVCKAYLGKAQSQKPKLWNGYYPHIFWKRKWRPLFFRPIMGDRGYPHYDHVCLDMEFVCYGEPGEARGAGGRWRFSKLIGDKMKVAPYEKPVKALEKREQPEEDCTIVEDILKQQLEKINRI